MIWQNDIGLNIRVLKEAGVIVIVYRWEANSVFERRNNDLIPEKVGDPMREIEIGRELLALTSIVFVSFPVP